MGMITEIRPEPRDNFIDGIKPRGYVHWEILDEDDNVIKRGYGVGSQWWLKYIPNFLHRFLPYGKQNAIVDIARKRITDWVAGGSPPPTPNYIGVGTGSTPVASADTGLETAVPYTGVTATAKIADTRTVFGEMSVRFVVSFGTTEITTGGSNVNIREFGLFSDYNLSSADMWARVNVNIDKSPQQKVNIYWYLVFERRTGLAIKSGESIGATGVITPNTPSTLSFASQVTICTIHNNTGQPVYIKLNGALSGTPPENYDFILLDGQSYFQSDEEIAINTISVYVNVSIASMPNNALVVRGW